jgi:(p)ppGpp synthase/HD superfamily hydrolase
VEVVRTEEGSLKIHMECVKRPHVLADIMEMLESSGMNVEEVSIAYDEDSQFVFDCVGSEVLARSSMSHCEHLVF